MNTRLARERRRDERERASIRVAYRSAGICGSGLVRNVTPAGAFVKTDRSLSEGDAVRLFVLRPNGTKEILTQGLVWRRDSGGFAVKFTEAEISIR